MCHNLTSNNLLLGNHDEFTLYTFSEESYQVFQPDTPTVGDYAGHCNEGQSSLTREIFFALFYCTAEKFHVLIKETCPGFESGGGEVKTF